MLAYCLLTLGGIITIIAIMKVIIMIVIRMFVVKVILISVF